MTPLASIIIPAFNAQRFIAVALASALAQTYPAIEVVVVDDGSTDDTRSMVEEFAQRDPRVRLFSQKNGGVGAARNYGIREARGEFIAPLDADDFWYPEKLARQIEGLLERGEEWGMSYCWSKSVDAEGNVSEPIVHWPVEGEVFEALIYRNIIGNASVPVFRAAALRKVGLYATREQEHGAQGCEDWDLTIRVARHYKVAAVPEYLSAYRQIPGTMTSNYVGMARSYEFMIDRLRRESPEIPERLLRWSAGHFYLYMVNICYGAGQYRQCFHLIGRLLYADLAAVLSPTIYRVMVMSVLRLVTGREVFKRERPKREDPQEVSFIWIPSHQVEARRWASLDKSKTP